MDGFRYGYISVAGVLRNVRNGYVGVMDVLRNGCVAVTDVLRNGYIAVTDVLQNRYVAVKDVLRNGYVAVKDVLRNGYAAVTNVLRNGYVAVTNVLRNGYVAVTNVLRNGYVAVTYVLRNGYVAVANVLRNGYVTVTNVLRNGYVAVKDVLCKSFHSRLIGKLCGVLLFLCLSILLVYWTLKQISSNLTLRVNDSFDCSSGFKKDAEEDIYWNKEYNNRLERVWEACRSPEFFRMTNYLRARTDCWNKKMWECQSKLCPIIVDEQQMLFCVIPNVASNHIRSFFLNKSNIHINATLKKNFSAKQVASDDTLLRISPTYYFTSRKFDNFYKIIFVRHPFDRLVAAFRSKAERSREEVPYYFNKYWDPIKKRNRQRDPNTDQITFFEFVYYLEVTDQCEYDEHWAPFWSRCNPCLVDYDFIGKLETAKHDFLHAFCEAGIEFSPEWFIDFQPSNHAITLKYFATIPKDMIRSLYKIYKLDFDLFGYSVDEFLS